MTDNRFPPTPGISTALNRLGDHEQKLLPRLEAENVRQARSHIKIVIAELESTIPYLDRANQRKIRRSISTIKNLFPLLLP